MSGLKMIKLVGDKTPLQSMDVTVELQKVDGGIEAVIVKDAFGNYIRIVKDGTYTDKLKILVEEPKKYTTLYDVNITKSDGGVLTYTNRTKDQADNLIRYENSEDVVVSEKQVEVDENDNVVDDLDGIPF